jgi:hypothetical protein
MSNQMTKPAADKIKLSSKHPVPQQAPQKLKLLVTIVDRNKGELYTDLLQSFDINVQMILAGEGTASTAMLQVLGLTNSDRAVLLSIVREDRSKEALQMLEEEFKTVRGGKGIAYTIPLKSVVGVAIYRFLSNNRLSMNGKGE